MRFSRSLRLRNSRLRPVGHRTRGIDSFLSPGRLPKRNVSPRYSEGSQTAHAFTPKVLRLRNCGLRPPGDTACGESIVFQVPGASLNGTCLPVVPKVNGEPVRFLPVFTLT